MRSRQKASRHKIRSNEVGNQKQNVNFPFPITCIVLKDTSLIKSLCGVRWKVHAIKMEQTDSQI